MRIADTPFGKHRKALPAPRPTHLPSPAPSIGAGASPPKPDPIQPPKIAESPKEKPQVKLTVKLVDAFQLRNESLDWQEFGNFATHMQFPHKIPKGEVWIANTVPEVERPFLIASAEAQYRAVEDGYTDDDAYEYGLSVERAERERSHSTGGDRPYHDEVPPDIYKELWKTVPGRTTKIQVWIVDGQKVRNMYKTDFVEGGHAFVYPFIPMNEIWLEDQVVEEERQFALLHEFTERDLMRNEEYDYDNAHEIASKEEFKARRRAALNAGSKAFDFLGENDESSDGEKTDKLLGEKAIRRHLIEPVESLLVRTKDELDPSECPSGNVFGMPDCKHPTPVYDQTPSRDPALDRKIKAVETPPPKPKHPTIPPVAKQPTPPKVAQPQAKPPAPKPEEPPKKEQPEAPKPEPTKAPVEQKPVAEAGVTPYKAPPELSEPPSKVEAEPVPQEEQPEEQLEEPPPEEPAEVSVGEIKPSVEEPENEPRRTVEQQEPTTAPEPIPEPEETAGPERDTGSERTADVGRPDDRSAERANRGVPPKEGRIVTVREDLTKPADTGVVPEDIQRKLEKHQVQGVAKMVHALRDYGGGILASGTGAGKTHQLASIAKINAGEGKKVLIVAPNGVLRPDWDSGAVTGSYKKASEDLGVNLRLVKDAEGLKPGQVAVTTYQNLEKFQGAVDKDTILILDESHLAKRIVGDINQSGQALQTFALADAAGGVLYSTATPIDKPYHLVYLFRAKVFGDRPYEDVFEELGLTRSGKRWRVNPEVGNKEVYRRLGGLFDRLTEDGLMVKHEINMKGVDVAFKTIELPQEAHDLMEEIARAGEAAKEAAAAEGKSVGLAASGVKRNQRAQQEPFKIPYTVQRIKEELAKGRRPIVFASRVNEAAVSGEGGEVARSEGTMKQLKEALAAAGITNVSEIHGGVSESDVRRQALIRQAIDDFQSGKNHVAIGTIESGGTGINLDDTVGDAPRSMFLMTPPFSGMDTVQAIGRAWRLTSKSYPTVEFVLGNTKIDEWNKKITADKLKTLNAAVSGAVGALDINEEEDEEELAERALAGTLGGERYQWAPIKPGRAETPDINAPTKPPKPKQTAVGTKPLTIIPTPRGISNFEHREPVDKLFLDKWRQWKKEGTVPSYLIVSPKNKQVTIIGGSENRVKENLENLRQRLGEKSLDWLTKSGEGSPREYGCLMGIIPDPIRKEITDWVLENVPEFHLGPGGRELRPHITIKYGFLDSGKSTINGLRALLTRCGPFTVRLTNISVFGEGYGKWTNEDGDVLKMDVESPQLHQLNADITASFDTYDKYPGYEPHLTLAYIDPSVSTFYEKLRPPFSDREITLDRLEFSGADGIRTDIPLNFLPALENDGVLLWKERTLKALDNIIDREDIMGWKNRLVKAMSWLNANSGAALVPDAEFRGPKSNGSKRPTMIKILPSPFGLHKSLNGYSVKSDAPQAPQVAGDNGSYFGKCERDEGGHCLPKGEAGQEATEQETAKPEEEKEQAAPAATQEAPPEVKPEVGAETEKPKGEAEPKKEKEQKTRPATEEEKKLAEGLVRRDRSAWNEAYTTYTPKLRKMLMNKGVPESKVDDVVQDAWMQVMLSIDKYDPKYSLENYLFTVTSRRGANQARSAKRDIIGKQEASTEEGARALEEVPESSQMSSPEDIAMSNEEEARVSRAKEDVAEFAINEAYSHYDNLGQEENARLAEALFARGMSKKDAIKEVYGEIEDSAERKRLQTHAENIEYASWLRIVKKLQKTKPELIQYITGEKESGLNAEEIIKKAKKAKKTKAD